MLKKKCLVEGCGELVDPRGTYQHVARNHPEYVDKWNEVKDQLFEEVEIQDEEGGGGEAEDEGRIEYQGEKYTPEDLIFAFGYEGLHILMRRELEQALEKCPAKISKKAKEWILDQFDRFEHYKQVPDALFSLVHSYGGVTPKVVQDIVSKVFSIPQKYQKIIELAMQTNPMLFVVPQQQQVQPTYIYQQQPQQQPPPTYIYQQQPQPIHTEFYPIFRQTPPSAYQTPPSAYQIPQHTQQPIQQLTQQYLTRDDLSKILEERDRKFFEDLEKREEEKERKRKEEEEKRALLNIIGELKKEIEELKKTDSKVVEEKPDWIKSLESRLHSLESKLRKEGDEEKKLTPTNLIKQAKELINDVKELTGTGKLEEELKSIKSKLESWTGEIDDKKLRIRELELQKEIKETEAKGWQSSAEKIASAIENFSRTFGSGFGESLAGKAGSKNMIVVGNEVRALCPKCATEFTVPVGEDVICPVCKHALWSRETGGGKGE